MRPGRLVRCGECRAVVLAARWNRCPECGADLQAGLAVALRASRVPLADQDVLFDTRMSRAVMFVVATGVFAGLVPIVTGGDAYFEAFGQVLIGLVALSLVAWLGSRYAPGRAERQKTPGCMASLQAGGMVALGLVSLIAGLFISLFVYCQKHPLE